MPQSLHQRGDLGGRFRAEFLPHERVKAPPVVQGLDPFASGGQRLHQSERGVGTEGVELGETTPPFHRRSNVACRCGPRCERLERFGRPCRQARALLLHPVFEFSGFAQIETIKEGPRIDSDGPRGISAIERLLEVLDVTADDLGVQSQLGRTEDQLGRVEIATEGVARLVEEVAAVLHVSVRPQICDELIAAHPAATRSSEEGEEGECLAPLRRAAGRAALRFHRQPTARLEVQHVGPFEPFLIGCSPAAPKLARCTSPATHGAAMAESGRQPRVQSLGR